MFGGLKCHCNMSICAIFPHFSHLFKNFFEFFFFFLSLQEIYLHYFSKHSFCSGFIGPSWDFYCADIGVFNCHSSMLFFDISYFSSPSCRFLRKCLNLVFSLPNSPLSSILLFSFVIMPVCFYRLWFFKFFTTALSHNNSIKCKKRIISVRSFPVKWKLGILNVLKSEIKTKEKP